MSNSSTSPVQYPLPYKAVDGCLYMEKANKNGTTTRKLCNFLPYITNEVEVDDGVERTRSFRIAGIHESGRMLSEIEVTVKEFEKMNTTPTFPRREFCIHKIILRRNYR